MFLDIICVQEHWLNKFEQDKIHQLLPVWQNHHIRSHDEYTLHENTHRPVGQGGVATLWANWLDPHVRKMEKEGNERILCTQFNIPQRPMCVINCYLSSGTSAVAIDTFMQDMDIIYELIKKFSPTHEIILTGDLNQDHYHRTGCKERKLSSLLTKVPLVDLGKGNGAVSFPCTYINPHLGHRSRLDHVFVKPLNQNSIEWLPSVIPDVNMAANTSKHHPLTSSTMIHTAPPPQKKRSKAQVVRKYKWSEANLETFTETLETELSQYSIADMDPDDALISLQHMLETATLAAVPYASVRVQPRVRRKIKWSPELANAVAASKQALYEWKAAGEPKGAHPAWSRKKKASRAVRSIQRQQDAVDRRLKLQEISCASIENQALFHKLVKQQRGSDGPASAMMVAGTLVTEEENIREGWADYFEHLSAPSSTEHTMEDVLEHMRQISALSCDNVSVSPDTVASIIMALRPKKAPDKDNLKAEHLKMLVSSPYAIQVLTTVFNNILQLRKSPNMTKHSYKLPIPKKGKDKLQMDNHRGITITSIFGKVLEHICLQLGEKDISENQHGLQYGFSKGLSPSMASLLVTEAIVESREMKSSLYICSVDARKAFDVVSQNRLRMKLYNTSLRKPLWQLIDDMYMGNRESVRWAGQDSREYSVGQGVRQGAILSPTLYKLYVDMLHHGLADQSLGLSIGPFYVGAPACADDFLLLADNPPELQGMIDVTRQYAEEHGYDLNLTKTVVCRQKVNPSERNRKFTWLLGDDPLSEVDSFQHLGLDWQSGKLAPDINSRISTARKTAYSLLGTGLHGQEGLDPPASVKLCNTYVKPRLLHGLEATIITDAQLSQIDVYYKSLLRQIQSLPQNVATPAIYLLSGSIPVKAHLHMRYMSMFGAIARLDLNNPLRQVATRQLAVKDDVSKSWFSRVNTLGALYHINIHQAISNPWPKVVWKRHVNQLIWNHWLDTLTSQAMNMSTLEWLILHPSWIGKPHPLWLACRGNTFQVQAAATRGRLLTSRYPLQQYRVRFTRQDSDPTCPLCNSEPEDAEHFLVRCTALRGTTDALLQDLCRLYSEEGLQPPSNHHELTSAILNGWAYTTDMGSQRPTSTTAKALPCPPHQAPSPTPNLNHITAHSSQTSPRPYQAASSRHHHLNHKKNATWTSATGSHIVCLNKSTTLANQLCNLICHYRHIKRDTELNNLLMHNLA